MWTKHTTKLSKVQRHCSFTKRQMGYCDHTSQICFVPCETPSRRYIQFQFFIICGFVAGGLEVVGVAQQTKMRKGLRQDDQSKTKSRLHTYIHTYYIHKCIVAVHETKANKIKQTLKRRAHAREPHSCSQSSL